MCMPHHIQTFARTCALALVCVCAWICLCAGMSTSASATTLASTRDIQSLTGIQNARSTTRANILLDAAATPAADTTISRIEVHSGTAVVSLTPPTSSGSSGLAYYQSTCSATGQPSVTSRSSAASNSVLIENLTPGISYDCTFSAYNLDGLGSPESAYITVLVSAGNTIVSIASPADGAVFSVPADVTITASANAGPGLSITRVDFYDGATLIGYTVAQPYNWTYTWTNAPQGTHAITVKAYDSLGNIAKSSVVNLTINGGANAPTITITAPNNGVVGTAVPITATVTTASGAVLSKIEYFEGTHSIGISSITSYAWTPLVPGVYTVTAKVTDSTGATGVSAPVIITVADASGETITFLHNDFAGSAIAATDAAGALLWKENYTPFGDRAVKAVNATGNRQWYTGKPVDSETGLSNFGARMYDPVIGRFMGVDAVGFSEGNLHSFNRYAYANNNPYRFVDPDGNDAVDAIMSFALGPFQKIGLMLGMNQHREAREYGASMQDGGQYLQANLDGIQAIGDITMAAISVASLPIGIESAAAKQAAKGAEALSAGGRALLTSNPIGRALKGDPAHLSATFMRDEAALNGTHFAIAGGDGVTRTLTQIPGELNGVAGRYEYIVDSLNNLTHQMFVRGGSINGIPIKP